MAVVSSQRSTGVMPSCERIVTRGRASLAPAAFPVIGASHCGTDCFTAPDIGHSLMPFRAAMTLATMPARIALTADRSGQRNGRASVGFRPSCVSRSYPPSRRPVELGVAPTK